MRPRLSAPDLQALGPWVATRVALLVLTVASAWQLGLPTSLTERWDRWDVGLFRKAAEFGYQGYPEHYPDKGIEAFFPGFPLVLRAVHALVPSYTAAGLLISFVAGGVAMVALSRLAALDGVPGPRAVTVLVLSPYAVFLAAGYSEALFLAFALPGWLAARRGDWRLAGVLVALSTGVRISGAFLAVGLVVHYAVTARRPSWDLAWLALPFVVLAGWFGYLWAITGDPLRWQHAQTEGWGRRFTLPWDAFRTSYDAMRDPGLAMPYRWSYGAEIVAVVVGVALTVWLVRTRRWGEATYLGLSVGALATSTYYLSIARATLLWFPLWVLVAQVGVRRPALHTAYVAVAAPLMAVSVLAFTSGAWVD